ncbi:unnamed protein product [Lactuca virosa]|uniref:Uncharacterized protein n=1 Tax=Lactuca virosa TaxID=75947 RepID=A0AAU9N4P4_9ASTR|nr:unnamed protein product [Lactuca virosa]
MWPHTEYLKPLLPLVRRIQGRPKTKRIRHASKTQDCKYLTQKAKIRRTIRCGKCRELSHNKLSCTNGEGPNKPVPTRKSGRPRGDGGGKLSTKTAKKPRKIGEGTSKEASEGKMKNVEGASKEACKMKDVYYSNFHQKRIKMMAMRGGKIKYVGRRLEDSAKQTIRDVLGSSIQFVEGLEEVSITCHEKA